ncbi:hypothetical protein BU23DRAFT_558805 [Bimuria novae-zelandiae CBS 107.79]|uniref:Ricin B lectin domain-containing protein n=1 Tax=Bimuria novae-zelandiae CBS 107.79 TaxID=1447943 RepID=A0A6A5UT09_9PLEO|nr:hypothetical protein BU23DRAFT_558805 [Bimuria novae-zelandiae CBS 107.79]
MSSETYDNIALDTPAASTVIPTPPSSTAGEKDEMSEPLTSSVPHPGKTFMLRDPATGRALTLLDGHVSLQPPGTPGSAYHWSCEERNGYLGFKNVAAGAYLGHDGANNIYALVRQQDAWEDFEARHMSNGGYVSVMKHWSWFQ